jgi:energy-converting hydrogenase Eha subunit C
LDGIILTTSTIFLLGLVIVLENPKEKWIGVSLLVIGLIGTSLLTYGSLFSLSIVLLILKFGFHYDHLEGFLLRHTSRIRMVFDY